jgi:hypothetical protein
MTRGVDAEPAPGEVAGADLEHGEVGMRIVTDDGRRSRATVGQRHLDRGRAPRHMVVGDEIAVGGDDEARSRSLAAEARRLRSFDAQVRDRGRDRGNRRGDSLRVGVEQRSGAIGGWPQIEGRHATADDAGRARFQSGDSRRPRGDARSARGSLHEQVGQQRLLACSRVPVA